MTTAGHSSTAGSLHVVIIPIYRNDEQLDQIRAKDPLMTELKQLGIICKFDDSDQNKLAGNMQNTNSREYL